MEAKQIRDLSIIKIDEKKSIIIACDSCGSIGVKPMDELNVQPWIVGKFAARVPLMEVLCTGAEVISVMDSLCNEMEPTGNEIIRGIKAELAEAGVDSVIVNGSTEENFKTAMTAVGVTVTGIANVASLKVNNIRTEADIVCVGLPKVGGEITLPEDGDLIDYKTIKTLLALPDVYEIVPVGSKGIAYEVQALAENNGMSSELFSYSFPDLYKSGGPATCAIMAIKKGALDKLTSLNKPMAIVGKIK